VQIMSTGALGLLPLYFMEFVTGSPFDAADLSNTSQGAIDIRGGLHSTGVINIPNANQIRVRAAGGIAAVDFSFVFEVGAQ